MIIDTWKRHVAKAASWRVLAVLMLCVTTYAVTGSLIFAGTIVAADFVIKTLAYLFHEWGWSRTNWGRKMTEKKGVVVWFTGLSGSGKTTVADAVAEKLRDMFIPVARLDGDVARKTFSKDLGFSAEDRAENCKRAAIVASYLKETNIVLASFISPSRSMRDYVKELCGEDTILVHIDCEIKECIRRDPKGMYAKLEDGCFMGSPFTGMHPDAPYDIPGTDEHGYVLCTDKTSLDVCVNKVIDELRIKGYL